jgi:hypothetical protein
MTKPSYFWPNFDFAKMAMQSTMLAIESQQVIAMRLTQMALGGPDVAREAELMVSEKMAAMAEGGKMMMMATLGGSHDMGHSQVMQMYRRKVRANKRRLAKV